MHAINLSACSSAFIVAFEAVKAGRSIRRPGWPEGQHLKAGADETLRVVRTGSTVFPEWAGPSSSEMDATDWNVV